MIHRDTENPAYKFDWEILALVKRPPGVIRLAEISEVFGLCGTYDIHQAIVRLRKLFPGLSMPRFKNKGYVLRCSKAGWPVVERAATEYLERLQENKK